MATISTSTNEKTISIKQFLGLNEAEDGDNKLKAGEATVCRNFKITDSGNLRKRFGAKRLYTLGDAPIKGFWHGWCTKHELCIAACNGHLWMLMDNEFKTNPVDLAAIDTTNDVFMFGFDEKVFLLNGVEYGEVYSYEQTVASTVDATVEGDITDATVTKATWETQITTGGTYVFTYTDGDWTLSETVVDITDYGIAVTGTAAEGDKITVVYTESYLETVWNYASLTNPAALQYLPPYRPLVRISVPPSGGGEDLQQVNKLCGARRLWISPDGVADTFYLPEKAVASIDYVKDLTTQTDLTPVTDYTYSVGDANTFASVTFTSTPTLSSNSYEIGWTVSVDFAATVGAMRYAELYAGTQDNRIFIYGDGSNNTFYSDLDYPEGKPRGDYFPDLNVITVGDRNTPITALIRHYSKMLAFKPEQTYSIDYGVVTLADGLLTPRFYSTPINKIIGNEPMGQVMLVLNAPISFCQGNLYEWRNGSSYSANISVDERQAKRISDRISNTLRGMDASAVHCYDDNLNNEYYIIDEKGNMLIHNYRVDAWYIYTNLNARIVNSIDGVLYIGTRNGEIHYLDEKSLTDNGSVIDCAWESGSMDFGASNMRKYSALMWVGIKAEKNNKITVTAKTDRSIENAEIEVDPDYENDMPKITRCKIKVKKFVYYKLCFISKDAKATATVVDTEIKVRYTSQAK